jgi:hypothetical protein
MVLAERSGNESKYNGTSARRSRAPSPTLQTNQLRDNSNRDINNTNNNANNGHFTDDSNNSDDSDHGLGHSLTNFFY